jgi:hypothetical protein
MASSRLEFYRRLYGPVNVLRRTALRRGVFHGNMAWLGVWIAMTTAATVKRRVTRQEQRLAVDALRPGQGLTIRTIPVASAKERKALLRGQN